MGMFGMPTVDLGPRTVLQDSGLSAHSHLWARSVSALHSLFLNTNDHVNVLKTTGEAGSHGGFLEVEGPPP